MKRKTIIITGILILTLLAVTGYFLYPYYVKQKTISEKTAEINTIEKDLSLIHIQMCIRDSICTDIAHVTFQ